MSTGAGSALGASALAGIGIWAIGLACRYVLAGPKPKWDRETKKAIETIEAYVAHTDPDGRLRRLGDPATGIAGKLEDMLQEIEDEQAQGRCAEEKWEALRREMNEFEQRARVKR